MMMRRRRRSSWICCLTFITLLTRTESSVTEPKVGGSRPPQVNPSERIDPHVWVPTLPVVARTRVFTPRVPVRDAPLSPCANCVSALPTTSWNQSHAHTLGRDPVRCRPMRSGSVDSSVEVPKRSLCLPAWSDATFQVAGFRRIDERVAGSWRSLLAAHPPAHAVSTKCSFRRRKSKACVSVS